MRGPLALACAVSLAASSAAAQTQKKLDLSGLLGGPSPAGPSAGAAQAGPEKDIVLAAIRSVPESEKARAEFALMFGTRNKPDGSAEAYDAERLKAAAAVLEGLINAGKISIGPTDRGAAGSWAPNITDGKMTGGEFLVGDPKSVKEPGRSSRNFSQLFKQDQYANTIIHEVVHMFYSVATLVQGYTPQSQPAVAENFRSYSFWNGTRPQSLPQGSYPFEKPPCGSPTCYQWKISSHGYGKDGNATEYLARTVSQGMCDEGNCAAYARVLDPVFR